MVYTKLAVCCWQYKKEEIILLGVVQLNNGGPNRELCSWILSKCLTGESGERVERVERKGIIGLDLAQRLGLARPSQFHLL